jgi:hypothetical protein
MISIHNVELSLWVGMEDQRIVMQTQNFVGERLQPVDMSWTLSTTLSKSACGT